MPPAANQALVPLADLPFFTAATVASLRARLTALAIPYNNDDRKYELYYRVAVTGNRILTMPVGYVPTAPPRPLAWPAPPPPAPRKS